MIAFTSARESICALSLPEEPEKYTLLPANICPEVPARMVERGIRYEICDLNPQTMDFRNEALKEHLADPDLHAILYVSPYGLRENPFKSIRACRRYRSDVALLLDSCLSLPQWDFIRPEFDAEIFSTGSKKVIDLGGGGLVNFPKGDLTPNHDRVAIALRLRDSICSYKNKIMPDQWHKCNNESLARYICDIDRLRCPIIAHKQSVNKIYDEHIKPEYRPTALALRCRDWRYNVEVKNKKKVLQEIFAAGYFASNHFAPLDGSGSSSKNKQSFDGVASVNEHIVNLFNDRFICHKDAIEIARIINCYGKGK